METEDLIVSEIQTNGGTMDQDALVDSLSQTASKEEVLHAARDLYDEGELSFSLDWQLMIEE